MENPRNASDTCVFLGFIVGMHGKRYQRFLFIMPFRVRSVKYPNNEIRVTFTKIRPLRSLSVDNGSITEETDSNSPPPLTTELRLERKDSGSLDISSELKRPGFGQLGRRTKFGGNAKNTLLRAGGAADQIAPDKDEWLFLTGTQPSGTEESFRALAEWSSYVVNALKAWINWHCQNTLSFYVWEFQKRGALHLHYAVHIPDAAARSYLQAEFKNEWKRLLDNVQEKSGVDMWKRKDGSYHKNGWHVLQAYAQTVKKSVVAYLAKYCSKEASSDYKVKQFGWWPVRWWGVSRPLLAKLRDMTETIDEEFQSFRAAENRIHYLTGKLIDVATVVHHYEHKVGLGLTTVSYSHPDQTDLNWSYVWQSKLLQNVAIPSAKNSSILMAFLREFRTTFTRLGKNSEPMIPAGEQPYRELYQAGLTYTLVWNSWVVMRLSQLISLCGDASWLGPYQRWILETCGRAVSETVSTLSTSSQSTNSMMGNLRIR